MVLLLIFCLDGCLAITSSTASSTVDGRCARNENAILIGLMSRNVVKMFTVGVFDVEGSEYRVAAITCQVYGEP